MGSKVLWKVWRSEKLNTPQHIQIGGKGGEFANTDEFNKEEYTTQIDNYENLTAIFDNISINTILVARDIGIFRNISSRV